MTSEALRVEQAGVAAVEASSAASDGRDEHGRWATGNTAALRHGGYSAAVRRGVTADAKATLADKRDRLTSDLGGELTQVQADLVERYVELDVVVRHLAGHLAREGVFTERGRTRAAFSALMQAIDRWHRVAMTIGSARVPKRVPTLQEWLAGLAAEPQPADASDQGASASPAPQAGNVGDDRNSGGPA